MAEGQISDKQLIEALLRERDELYRRVTKAERRLEELSDTESMRQLYETRIKEMEADHQKLISDMEADFQKEFSKIPRRRTRYVTSCAAWNTWLASYGAG